MYNRAEELKKLLNAIPEFNEAIYDDGILRDIRFKFEYFNEKFLYIYKFDYSNPRLYRLKKDNILNEVKDFIIPKEIKQKIISIHDSIECFQKKYFPLIPNQKYEIGRIIFKTKFLNEYANNQKEINFISTTFEILIGEEMVNQIELEFIKEDKKWIILKDNLVDEKNYLAIQTSLAIFKNELLKKINDFETKEIDILEMAKIYLKRTE